MSLKNVINFEFRRPICYNELTVLAAGLVHVNKRF